MIPYGKVATYGQVADLAGLMGKPRVVGYALFRVTKDTDIPWHRVVNAKGEVSRSSLRDGNDDLQQHLLEQEGVSFKKRKIDLGTYRWKPQFTLVDQVLATEESLATDGSITESPATKSSAAKGSTA